MSKPSTVIARLMGGLGNQLFCYAAARALAESWKAELFLDTKSGFQRDKYQRKFALANLVSGLKEATNGKSYNHLLGRWRRGFDRKLGTMGSFAYLKEGRIDFNALTTTPLKRRTVYLDGLWQNPGYFNGISEKLRGEIRPRELSSESREIEIDMSRRRCASIHIRQYDDAKAFSSQTHCLQLSYYENALRRLLQNTDIEHFYCFSDNPVWVRTNLSFSRPVTYVEHNLERGETHAYEDMWLMSRCSHHIIANSTFSWWGAWLGHNADRVVIAPAIKEWPADSILPERWETV